MVGVGSPNSGVSAPRNPGTSHQRATRGSIFLLAIASMCSAVQFFFLCVVLAAGLGCIRIASANAAAASVVIHVGIAQHFAVVVVAFGTTRRALAFPSYFLLLVAIPVRGHLPASLGWLGPVAPFSTIIAKGLQTILHRTIVGHHLVLGVICGCVCDCGGGCRATAFLCGGIINVVGCCSSI